MVADLLGAGGREQRGAADALERIRRDVGALCRQLLGNTAAVGVLFKGPRRRWGKG